MNYTIIFDPKDRVNFENISSGLKTIEVRAVSEDPEKLFYAELVPGDEILFLCESDRLTKTVKQMRRYSSLEDLIEVENFALISPKSTNKKAFIECAYEFPGYKDRVNKLGVLAIEVCDEL